tara:strand:- start:708 stop:2078 length:1371 start_codon:yes stop_codon:yes gene_type:complete
MKIKLKYLLQNLKKQTYFILLVGFVSLSFYSQFSSKEILKTSIVNEGLHTCFARVNQSFTAKFLGSSGSSYLTEPFMKATEECYGDVTYVLEENFKGMGNNIIKKAHNLSSNIHWLHRNLSKERSELSKLNISSRFQEIEGINDSLLDEIKIIQEKIESGVLWSNFLFYPFVLIIFGAFFFEFFKSRKIVKKNNARELEANQEINKGESLIVGKVENIILSALKSNNLNRCASLFSIYQSQIVDGKVSKFLLSPSGEEKDKNFIEEEQKDVAVKDIGISADAVLSKVIDIHSSKIFTQGVKLDLNVEDNVNVQGDQESLEQIFYYLILNAVNSGDNSDNKKVSIKLKKLGGTVVIELTHSGKGFPKELILDQLGLEKLDESTLEKKLGIELTIVKTLIKESQGELSLENLKESNGEVIGAKVRLALVGAKKEDSAELSNVKKGKKKEIKEYLDNQL